MITDDDLNKLEDSLRRLRISYESYFGGGLKKPPRDASYRLESTLKRMSEELPELTLRQRFRLNQLQQKYMVYGGLWRKRLRDIEEGRGLKTVTPPPPENVFRVVVQGLGMEAEQVNQLFDAFVDAKRQMGEPAGTLDRGVFAEFVRGKTAELKQKFDCEEVEFCVKVEDGRVKLKAGRR